LIYTEVITIGGETMRYEHKRDEVDDLMLALGRVHDREGIAAARAVLPKGILPAVERLMILLRTIEKLEALG
jgi:hypothetical protein